ncbi:MAG: hypothetical protein WBD02_08445 [Acidimicrobiia bacterium]
MAGAPRPEDEARFEIAVIGKPHGLRGEVTVRAISNVAERFVPGAKWIVGDAELEVLTARSQREGYVVHLEGIGDRTAAESLRGSVVFGLGEAPEADLVHRLIGRLVIVAGEAVGVVTSVEANPAHDILVLDSGVLIPMVFVDPLAHDADPEDPLRAVVPEGLLELSQTQAAPKAPRQRKPRRQSPRRERRAPEEGS